MAEGFPAIDNPARAARVEDMKDHRQGRAWLIEALAAEARMLGTSERPAGAARAIAFLDMGLELDLISVAENGRLVQELTKRPRPGNDEAVRELFDPEP